MFHILGDNLDAFKYPCYLLLVHALGNLLLSLQPLLLQFLLVTFIFLLGEKKNRTRGQRSLTFNDHARAAAIK